MISLRHLVKFSPLAVGASIFSTSHQSLEGKIHLLYFFLSPSVLCIYLSKY